MASPEQHGYDLDMTSATGSVSGNDGQDKQSARNPACDSCREKKVRCGRERPTCQNCRTWKVRCAYSERQKRDNEASRNAQRFDDVNERLDRIESTMGRLVAALENIQSNKAVPCPETPAPLAGAGEICKRCSGEKRPHVASLARSEPLSLPVDLPLAPPDRGKSVMERRSDLMAGQYLGSSSLLSITAEAGSLAEEKLRNTALATNTSAEDARPWSEEQEAISALQNLSTISTEAARQYPQYGAKELRAGSDRATMEIPKREEAEELLGEYFKSVYCWYPIFSKESLKKDFELFYTDGEHRSQMMRDRAWLTCFYNVCLFGLYAKLSINEGMNWRNLPCGPNNRVTALYWNAMAAGDHIDMFLSPRLRNIQALCTVATVTVEVSRPGLCWSVLSQAARLSQAIGLNRSTPKNAQSLTKDQMEERKNVFWSIYMLDKCLSLTFGRSPCLPDFDCDVELPEDDGSNPCYRNNVAMIHLSKIQSSIYVRLYSAAAGRDSVPERESAIKDLDKELRDWWSKYEHLSSTGSSFAGRALDSFEKLELGFSYYSSLTLVHRMALPMMSSYAWCQSVCLESSRTSMRMVIDNAETDTPIARSGLLMWLFHYYPFTSFFVLFSAIIRNPSAPQSQSVDYELMRGLVHYLERMSVNNEGAARFLSIASAFAHVAGTFLRNYRNAINQPSDGSHPARKRRRHDPPADFGNSNGYSFQDTTPTPATVAPPSLPASPDIGNVNLHAASFLRWPGMGLAAPTPNAAISALRPPEIPVSAALVNGTVPPQMYSAEEQSRYEMDLQTLMAEPLDFQTQMEQAAARGPLEFDWFSWDGQIS